MIRIVIGCFHKTDQIESDYKRNDVRYQQSPPYLVTLLGQIGHGTGVLSCRVVFFPETYQSRTS